MKSLFSSLCLAFVLILSGCTVVNVDQGEEAVLIDKPWFFGHGGIRSEPVKPGLIFTWFSTWPKYVVTYPQRYEVKFDDLMSKDGVPLDFEASIRLQVVSSVDLIGSYGEHWYGRNVEQAFRNFVRTSVKKYGMNETAIDTTAIAKIDDEVGTALSEYLLTEKIPVKLLDLTVGKANPPDSIKTSRIATASEQQRVLTESFKKQAEDARKQSEISRAAADNAYRNAMELSPDQFIQLEQVKAMKDTCIRQGTACTFLIGTNVQPVLSVR